MEQNLGNDYASKRINRNRGKVQGGALSFFIFSRAFPQLSLIISANDKRSEEKMTVVL